MMSHIDDAWEDTQKLDAAMWQQKKKQYLYL